MRRHIPLLLRRVVKNDDDSAIWLHGGGVDTILRANPQPCPPAR